MTLTPDDLRFLAGHIKDAATFDMGGLPDKSLKRLAKHLKQVAADLDTETPEVTEERAGFEARAWAEQYTAGMSQKEAAAFKRGHAAGWRDAGAPAPQDNTDRFGEFLRAETVCATLGIEMAELELRVEQERVLRVETADGMVLYPAVQFQGDRIFRSHLQAVLRVLRPAASDGWTVLYWLTSPLDEYEGRTPIDLLRAGLLAQVLMFAEEDAAAWRSARDASPWTLTLDDSNFPPIYRLEYQDTTLRGKPTFIDFEPSHLPELIRTLRRAEVRP